MDTKLFKMLAGDYNDYNLDEVEEMEIMTIDEVNNLQRILEKDSGDYTNWDLLRLCFTCKNYLLG